MNRSSRGLSSRLRASTLSGNWTMDCHSRLRKLGKSVLSLGSVANCSCSRNRTPTSPLWITSQPGSALVPSVDSPWSSSSSCSCFSVTINGSRVNQTVSAAEDPEIPETCSPYQPVQPPSPAAHGRPPRTLYCPSLLHGSCGSKETHSSQRHIGSLTTFGII